ncbi:hypothetical protein HNR62_001031 [Oceanisphaera litoralis]|uniref:phage head spike fiber domain-containing protein n=1 Tax=Oceanisphaera litoralis TaxID=225144 RepID=UPI00195A03FF|nr:hypothetical protein [Oceanisphaera litoralis]MBM7455171.1 hypothetical protein [Oceanisphaera litoralis]
MTVITVKENHRPARVVKVSGTAAAASVADLVAARNATEQHRLAAEQAESGANSAVLTATTQAGISTAKANEASDAATLAGQHKDTAQTAKATATEQANTATTKAAEASASAAAALSNKNASETAASTATQQAGVAATKANEASSSATIAGQHKNAAEAAASTATTKAGDASSSASTASQSQSAAASNEAMAKEWADKTVDSAITGNAGKYSAKHHATKAAASASAASSSASTANTKADEASSSAITAGQHKANAETAAGTATTQAGIATTKAGEAAGSADAADQAKTDTINAISLAHLPEPDVFIPFKDSLEIVRGYGTHDTIDVSAAQDGSQLVQLPSRSVDFSRASGATGINKSGELVSVGIDEPVITADGLFVAPSFTNLSLWSDDWTVGAYKNGWGCGSGFFANSVIGDHPESVDGMVCHMGPNVGVAAFNSSMNQQILASLGAAATYTIQADLKAAGATTTVRFLPVPSDAGSSGSAGGLLYLTGNGGVYNTNFSAGNSFGEQLHFSSVPIGNGWYRVTLQFTTTRNIADFRIRFFPYINSTEVTGDGESGLYGKFLQVRRDAIVSAPRVRTEGAMVTRSPDIATIPTRNNLPAPGKPFTIVLDTDNSELGRVATKYFMVTGLVNSAEGIIRISANPSGDGWQAGNIYDGLSLNRAHLAVTGVPAGKVRCVLKCDGNDVSIYFNGVFYGKSSATLPIKYGLNDGMNLGGYVSAGYEINSCIKLFSIYHTDLTDEQISALGGPQ